MTYYKTLGVAETASLEEITQAYEQLKNETTEENRLATLNQAYFILKDQEKRAAYDKQSLITIVVSSNNKPLETTELEALVPMDQIIELFHQLTKPNPKDDQKNPHLEQSLFNSGCHFEIIPGTPNVYRFTFNDAKTAEEFVNQLIAKGYVVVNTPANQLTQNSMKEQIHGLRQQDSPQEEARMALTI